MQETIDESDETLSLCDLPLYSDHQSVEEWQQERLSTQSQGSSSVSSCEQDYFEFCSQELNPSSTTGYPPESIIFCGKLIPSRKQHDTSDEDLSKLVEIEKAITIKKRHGWDIFRWVFCLSRNNQKSTTLMHKDRSAKNTYKSQKQGKKEYDYPVHKMPLLTSSSSGKARWCLFLLGGSRFSSEVEIKDMKSRLSRRHSTSSPATLSSGPGLSGLIRVLSCGVNHHPNTMVVASTTYSKEK
ncbi:hypothetical protein PHJA_001741100 [Phtheirospermum japonicum]|uniref:Uncharacterized protein n=1 Tax=Phtheirospermum japonicum TaxID=374723 RepID=A0A830C8S2_9LAMI|nr:hypothetical protein PHJA_001741100 [Phtheirospermum japonicum]